MTPAAIDSTFAPLTRSGHFGPVIGQTPAVALKTRTDRSTQPPAKRSWKKLAGAVFVLAALAAAGAATQPWKKGASPSAPAANERHERRRSVKVVRPTPAAAASVVLPATFRPWQTTALHARVSGYLGAWHQDLGARVKEGELLAEIETPELDQELAEGKALAREALAAAAQARAERTEAEADLKMAEAQLARIQAETELIKSQLARREKLLTTRAITQEEYDTFLRQTEARTAEVAAAKADVVRRRANLNTRTAIIEVREATAKSRQANVARLEELQTFKRIVAPFDGVVIRRTAEVGMLVTAGQESLFVLEDTSRIRVQVSVPQTYSAQTSPGVAASISVPESVVQGIQGTITRIAGSVDSASRTMLAEIELENASGELQPGSYAQATLVLPQEKGAWSIPTSAVSMRVEGPHVAVVNDQSRIEIRRVHLGRDLGARVVVLEGIRGDEQLVVNPGDDLADGAAIQLSAQRAGGEEVARR